MDKKFFARDTEEVARDLLGSIIQKDGRSGRIVETEAYLEEDPASHAYPEKTKRNCLMYDSYGKVYVYLCYGVHNMLNFTTNEETAGGVLIRAIEPLEGIEKMKENRGVEDQKELCNGPGKICEALDIDKEMKGDQVGERLELFSGESKEVEESTRIGISKAKDSKLRFYVPGNEYVSDR